MHRTEAWGSPSELPGLRHDNHLRSEKMAGDVKTMAVLTAEPGKARDLRLLLDNLIEPSRSEPGNLLYDL